jgi:branched-chain amino acid aminotransferase
MAKVWLNAQLVDDAQASVSVRDYGLLHAAGVFTTLRVYGGRPFRLADHLARLRGSCEALLSPLQYTNDELTAGISALLKANGLQEARMRITVTRGEMVHDPESETGTRLAANVFITATTLEPYPQSYYDRGLTVIACDQQKLNPYDIQAGHKTVDYFSRFAGLRDAVSRGAGEALWFNVHNYLQSGTVGNVFLVTKGTLQTPPTQDDLADDAIRERTPYPRSNVLPGVTRKLVLEMARKNNIPVEIGAITIQQVLDAEELFLTNSIMEVMPICRIERKPVGAERPGDLTRRISALYRKEVNDLIQGE